MQFLPLSPELLFSLKLAVSNFWGYGLAEFLERFSRQVYQVPAGTRETQPHAWGDLS
jgi:hypothetical protein